MQQDILINWSPQETRVAVVENGTVQELHLERALERGLVGNIYLGRVARVLPGMQSAFVEIGLDKAAFLHVADVWQAGGGERQGGVMAAAGQAAAVQAVSVQAVQVQAASVQAAAQTPPAAPAAPPAALATAQAAETAPAHPSTPTPTPLRPVATALPIEKQVFEGQPLMVQVMKEPINAKGARLSTQISIAGRLLVFLPQDAHIGISQKIPFEQREALRTRLQTLAAQGLAQGQHTGGFILRTNAEDASDAELAEDMAYLRKTWARIRQAAQQQPAPALLHQDLSLLQRVLRDLVGEATQSIRIDSREQHAALAAFGREFMPQAAAKLQHYRGERPIFDLFGIDEEISRALGRRVELKSGGYLIFDQTEALTTIDVNTGGYVGARNFDDTIFKTNLEAAQAIARQLRLRNLGGIVIIDFIDMARDEHQQAVLAELRKQLARDRVKTMTSGFSQLGLVEMTRKRTRESLAQQLTEPCAACQGRGSVKTPRTLAYDILREILREARQFNPREFRVLAAPAVIDLLLDEESQHLAGLSDFIGKPISLQAESAMGAQGYDIVLL